MMSSAEREASDIAGACATLDAGFAFDVGAITEAFASTDADAAFAAAFAIIVPAGFEGAAKRRLPAGAAEAPSPEGLGRTDGRGAEDMAGGAAKRRPPALAVAGSALGGVRGAGKRAAAEATERADGFAVEELGGGAANRRPPAGAAPGFAFGGVRGTGLPDST